MNFTDFKTKIIDYINNIEERCADNLLKVEWRETKNKINRLFRDLNIKYSDIIIEPINPLLNEFFNLTVEHIDYMEKNFKDNPSVILEWLFDLSFTINNVFMKIQIKQ